MRRLAGLLIVVAVATTTMTGCGSSRPATFPARPLADCGRSVPTRSEAVAAYGIDDTGHVCWETALQAPSGSPLAPADPPVVDGDEAFFVQSPIVEALDEGTGRVRWHRVVHTGYTDGVVTAGEGVVVVQSSSALTGLDERSGSIRWTRPEAPRATNTPDSDGGILISGGSAADLEVDEATGAVRPGSSTLPAAFGAPSRPSTPGETLAADADGKVVGVDQSTGRQLTVPGGTAATTPYLVAANADEVVASDGNTSIAATTYVPSQILWQAPNAAYAGLLVGDTFFGDTLTSAMSSDEVLAARSATTGAVRWQVPVRLPGRAELRPLATPQGPAVLLVFSGQGTEVEAFLQSNGARLWTAPIAFPDYFSAATPVEGGALVMVPDQAHGYSPP